ncbi:uncharacterized protein TNCV_2575401 [Trichonephila clavipes]|uniref:Tc1-like transposase DDE domain-containing protein n=1 Tax=Trichonephila clavipes TaxID=2585209 RepID=A0A8X6UZ18_TRICX|nr:uncharacterized protein TNCV_2575401 [Trichonephila clavipes]
MARVWGGTILGSITDLNVQSVTMTGHIYRDVILEQHVRLFRGTKGAEFQFMDDNTRPHRANIVDECLQSEDITRMDWPAYSPDLNPIEHAWDMLGRRIAARKSPPTCLPELWRALLDEWCNIPQDQIDNLIFSMPRRWDQDKSWAAHVVCSECAEEQRQWFKGKKKSFRFAVSMIWRKPKNHSDDCYFCSCPVQGFNIQNQKDISYPTIIRSAIRPVPHGPDLSIPSPPNILDNIFDDFKQISHISSDSDDGFDPGTNDLELFSQSDLNNLVRDLGLPKDTAEVLGSRLKERHLLNSGISFSCYRFREKEFVPFFTQELNLVFCSNVPAILEMFKIMYEPEEWRLFFDSSKRSLKAVLLHNGNRYASVPVGHLVHLKECYENLEFIHNKLSYSDRKWTICGDLKAISMLLDQQNGYTMFPCFLCEWDSIDRKQHY